MRFTTHSYTHIIECLEVVHIRELTSEAAFLSVTGHSRTLTLVGSFDLRCHVVGLCELVISCALFHERELSTLNSP